MHTDLLQCNPDFNHKEHHDCVIINDEPRKDFFAHLQFVFTYTLKASNDIIIRDGSKSISIPFALVQPMMEVPMKKKERDLRLIRVCEKDIVQCVIIPARSIRQGAFIIPEEVGSKTSMVVDVVDSDTFLRLLKLCPPSYS
jgi:hypothetical protein